MACISERDKFGLNVLKMEFPKLRLAGYFPSFSCQSITNYKMAVDCRWDWTP